MRITVRLLIAVFAVAVLAGFGYGTSARAASSSVSMFGSCGTGTECYSVPDGCGVGVGCMKTWCTENDCPGHTGSSGDPCYYCVEEE